MHQRRAEQENGSAYPELDKLMLICELFHCTLDDLLKGDMKENSGVSRDTYETHELTKTKGITVGIGCIPDFRNYWNPYSCLLRYEGYRIQA